MQSPTDESTPDLSTALVRPLIGALIAIAELHFKLMVGAWVIQHPDRGSLSREETEVLIDEGFDFIAKHMGPLDHPLHTALDREWLIARQNLLKSDGRWM